MAVDLTPPTEPTKVYAESTDAYGAVSCSSDKPAKLVLALKIPANVRPGSMFFLQPFGDCKVFSPGNQAEAIRAIDPDAPALPERSDCWFICNDCSSQREFQFDICLNPQDPYWKTIKTVPQTIRLEFQIEVYEANGARPANWRRNGFLVFQVKWCGNYTDLRGAFAVDLGTTNTCAAYWGDDGKPHLFRFEGRTDSSIPTVILYSKDEATAVISYSIGASAQTERISNGDERRRRRRTKQLLDLPTETRSLDLGLGTALKLIDDIYVDILRRFLGDFERRHARRLRRIKATYPPEYPIRSRQAMLKAYEKYATLESKEIDLNILHGIDEASAAAVYYFWRKFTIVHAGNLTDFREVLGDEHQVMVFDMGGGTTDIAIVTIKISPRLGEPEEVAIKVLGTASLNNLGGDNFTVHILRAIKCRLAVAAGKKYVDRPVSSHAMPSIRDQVNALRILKQRAGEFEAILDTPAPDNETEAEMERILGELENLADQVIPTQAGRLEKARRDDRTRPAWEVLHAKSAFLQLWDIAESYKIKLAENDEVRLDATNLGIGSIDVFKNEHLNFSDDELANIVLKRNCDLYRRIRPLIRRAVLTCRNLLLDVNTSLTALHTIQLVGNSCKIPLVRAIIEQELEGKPIKLVSQRIEFNKDEAKACVALGACIASQIMDAGIKVKYKIKFEPAPERLGWEILWSEVGQIIDMTEGELLFDAACQPSRNPERLIDDSKTVRQITVVRRRPGANGTTGIDPELLGFIDLNDVNTAEVKPAPPNKLRFLLLTYAEVAVIRGNRLYRMKVPADLRTAARSDPYSGWH